MFYKLTISSMEAVKTFLSEKGLSQYNKQFEDAGYDDLEIIKKLDSQQFDELAQNVGLKPGHKAKLQQVISRIHLFIWSDFCEEGKQQTGMGSILQ